MYNASQFPQFYPKAESLGGNISKKVSLKNGTALSSYQVHRMPIFLTQKP